MQRMIDLRNVAANLMIPFTGFYLTRIMPLSPVYFFFIAGFITYAIYLAIKKEAGIDRGTIGVIAFLLYLLVSQPFLGGDGHVFVNVVMSLLCYIFGVGVLRGFSKDEIIEVSERLIRYSMYLLIIEALWRFSHPVYSVANVDAPDTQLDEDLVIYRFKLSSIMYQDSNFVGIFIISLYFFLDYLKTISGKKYKAIDIMLFILTVLTLSRAAIIAIILFKLLFRIVKKFSLFLVLLFGSVVLLAVTGAVIVYLSTDESFESKFMLFTLLFDYLRSASLMHILFGTGFANAVKYFNMGSHNFLITYIMDTGFIGLLMLIVVWIDIAVRTRGKVLLVILPFLFVGMSLAGHAIPYLYAIFAIIYTIENMKKKTNLHYAPNTI